MAGSIIMREARENGARILPVDSEHSAIWQCLRGEEQSVSRLILTASGGPFRSFSAGELEQVTPEQALKHPSWKMGKKVTIDSATLMNKGLEIIEAHWLFDMPYEKIQVVPGCCPSAEYHSFHGRIRPERQEVPAPPFSAPQTKWLLSYFWPGASASLTLPVWSGRF